LDLTKVVMMVDKMVVMMVGVMVVKMVEMKVDLLA
jgi:hypothetical protein